MKKSIIIFGIALTILGLIAFGIINRDTSDTNQIETLVSEEVAINKQAQSKIEKRIYTDFIYDVGPRFGPMKKGDLDKAKSINDFLDEKQIERIVSIKSVRILLIEDGEQVDTGITGYSEELTTAQLRFLQSANYSTNFVIRADFLEKNEETGIIGDGYTTPHKTIVPEKQAVYQDGKKAIMEYLKESSKEIRDRVNVQADKLQPAKLFFTVTKNGTIENIHLDRTSNYPLIDETMIELISTAPGEWVPAENTKGEKVDQELVVSFGLMGC